jgi:c-di-GMP phosphodiesterase
MDLFVARQPIFDARRQVVGYELLYRKSAEAAGAAPGDPNRMSSDVIVQNFLEAGLSRLTGGLPGHVNFTREMLLSRTYELFDPKAMVVELLEDVEGDAEVIIACRRLRARGYTLALDDYVIGGIQEPLLEHANMVKVDLLGRSSYDVERIAAHLRPFFGTLLAERVENAAVAEAAEQQGFTLFQGYHFSRPETIGHRSAAVESLRLLPLLNMVQTDEVSFSELERVFSSDPTLSYKLLQIAQQATNGSYGVKSIRHAIHLVGRDILLRWVSLLLASSLATSGVHSAELLGSTLLRARFLESMAGRSREDAGSLFLVGLFSNMGALLQMPLGELLARVRLTDEVQEALERRPGSALLPYLELAEAYEIGEWEQAATGAADVGLDTGRLPGLYLRAVQWATSTLEVVIRPPPPRRAALAAR